MHGVGHRGIDPLGEDEGLQRLEQLLAERSVAGHRPGPQQRSSLPGATEALVVALGRHEGVGQRPLGALRSQAQVHPEDEAVLRHLGERAGRAPRQPAEEFVDADVQPFADRALVRAVEEADVDVAPEVELAAAELAHAQHHHADRRSLGVDRHPVASLQGAPAGRQRRLEGRLGELRQLPGRVVDVRVAADLAGRDAHHLRVPELAQRRQERLVVLEIGRRRPKALAQVAGRALRPRGQDRLAHRRVEEEQGQDRRGVLAEVLGQRAHRLRRLGPALDQRLPGGGPSILLAHVADGAIPSAPRRGRLRLAGAPAFARGRV